MLKLWRCVHRSNITLTSFLWTKSTNKLTFQALRQFTVSLVTYAFCHRWQPWHCIVIVWHQSPNIPGLVVIQYMTWQSLIKNMIQSMNSINQSLSLIPLSGFHCGWSSKTSRSCKLSRNSCGFTALTREGCLWITNSRWKIPLERVEKRKSSMSSATSVLEGWNTISGLSRL